MNSLDWLVVVALNGSIIAFGFYLARGLKSSSEWFLAGRSLPWWIVGLSMYATAIDASDLVADSGGTYSLGFTYFTANMVGTVVGWAIAGFFVFLPMYRAGMFTNAEYLEARFGPATRVLCAFIQVQYRTLVLGVISGSLYWTLRVVCEWEHGTAITTLVLVAILAAVYTAFGGLRSVAITDSLQFVVMTIAAVIVWFFVLDRLGGWSGLEESLRNADGDLSHLLHVGEDRTDGQDVSDRSQEEIDGLLLLGGEYREVESRKLIERTTPGWLLAIGLFIAGLAYPIVNHTQSMRMFASRSEWDLKMSVFVAGLVLIVLSFFNLSMGVLGRAMVPDPAGELGGHADRIYPWLVAQVDIVGLKGIVVAGIFAATFSTYDSIGSSVSTLLTRDVYARLLVRDRDDHHYLRVGQWLTPVVIGISFVYLPSLLAGGMLFQYLSITSAFVVPLLTVFLVGRFTSVHRSSGLIGLLAGSAYGILRLAAPSVAAKHGIAILPDAMIDPYGAYIFAMVITTVTMLLVSLIRGWEAPGIRTAERVSAASGWLGTSQAELRELSEAGAKEGASACVREETGWLPAILAIGVIAFGAFVCFVLFW